MPSFIFKMNQMPSRKFHLQRHAEEHGHVVVSKDVHLAFEQQTGGTAIFGSYFAHHTPGMVGCPLLSVRTPPLGPTVDGTLAGEGRINCKPSYL